VEDRTGQAVVVASDRVASAAGAPSELYASAIRDRISELDRCAHAHLDGLPDNATVAVRIGGDGRVKNVVMTPDRDEWMKLGGCIRDVLQSVAFPSADDDKELALALHRSEHTSE
jgi:hypothetical protein